MNDLIDEIIKMLTNSKLSHYKISADTGITAETISNYRRGKTKPSGANSKVLAKYFGISQDSNKAETIIAMNSNETITIPLAVWKVIEDQAASLRSKDEQTSEVIALLKEQIKKGGDADERNSAAKEAAES